MNHLDRSKNLGAPTLKRMSTVEEGPSKVLTLWELRVAQQSVDEANLNFAFQGLRPPTPGFLKTFVHHLQPRVVVTYRGTPKNHI